ncbi:MAG TPA: hydantoinase/oxoprolinase family protein [Acidimicrobiia bacterium]
MRLVGVDVGGTFTDFAIFEDGVIRSFKVPTSRPQSRAIIEALEALSGDDFTFVHGTTAATNSLLELTGARTALVTDVGFEDLVEIGRQKRVSLYDLSVDRPIPLVASQNRVGHEDAPSTIRRLRELGPESIAISLLGSFADASEEIALLGAIAEALPDIPVSVGSNVSPGFREYERTETTVVNAYLTPAVATYLDELASSAGASSSHVMTSSGGLIPFVSAAERVGELTLSGPAGGVVASDALRRSHGLDSVITFDMGGTSTDVSRIGPEGIVVGSEQVIGGRVNRVPSIAIHTVGAGGGSIAWVDPGGALRVGPRSAGADPGPVGYGLGGVEPTVTDANLHLGYIPETGMAGGLLLDRAAATEALGVLGDDLGLSVDEAATGILRIVDAHMERALRKVSIEEGFDPSESSLVAFGGAGGLHATRLARALHMRSVIIPPHTGVFSALGLLMAGPRVEVLKTELRSAGSIDAGQMASIRTLAGDRFREVFGSDPDDVLLYADARYESQSHELAIALREGRLSEDFETEHELRFGFRLEGAPVEMVNLRAVATGAPDLTWSDLDPDGHSSDLPAGAPIPGDRGVLDRDQFAPGFRIEGPVVVTDATATILLNDGEHLEVLEDSTLEITW